MSGTDSESSGSEDAAVGEEDPVLETLMTHDYNNAKISLVKGSIEKETVDVIVNSTSQKLDLSSGAASRALLLLAGEEVQQECKTKYPNGVTTGEVAVTGPGKLTCKHIYHGSLAKWGTNNAEKIHEDFILKCLEKATSDSMTSMALPGLTTGYLRFPKDIAAGNTRRTIARFIEAHPSTTLQDIRLVIHHSDRSTLEAFKREIKGWREAKDTENRILCSITKSPFTITLKISRIEREEVDVIVNSTASNLQLNRGTLARDLFRAAGPSLKMECEPLYKDGLKEGDIAVTGGGNLKCKRLFHACLINYTKEDHQRSIMSLKNTVVGCLDMAENDGMVSIALPALGTKYRKYPAKEAACTIFDGLEYFFQYSDSLLTDIRIVIHGVDLEEKAKIFQEEAERRQKAWVTKERGTPGFCKAKYQQDLFPPPYWTRYTSDKSVKKWKMESKKQEENFYKLVDVDDKTKLAVEHLVSDTWDLSKVGHGKDAAGLGKLGFTKLKITKVQRIENIDIFENYGHCRSRLFHKAADTGMFDKLESLRGSKGELHTSQHIEDILRLDMYPEVNECFLFHGTKSDTWQKILSQGLDFRMAGERGMFGQGIYLAESSTKADQYTDPKYHRNKEEKKMFLVRTCLGKICLLDSAKANLRKPPCCDPTCDPDSCQHGEYQRYDSVVGDGTWIFREFVLYGSLQCYPEYLISYIRE